MMGSIELVGYFLILSVGKATGTQRASCPFITKAGKEMTFNKIIYCITNEGIGQKKKNLFFQEILKLKCHGNSPT